jgi:hypothetical protein
MRDSRVSLHGVTIWDLKLDPPTDVSFKYRYEGTGQNERYCAVVKVSEIPGRPGETFHADIQGVQPTDEAPIKISLPAAFPPTLRGAEIYIEQLTGDLAHPTVTRVSNSINIEDPFKAKPKPENPPAN